jgi:hypothetical protein
MCLAIVQRLGFKVFYRIFTVAIFFGKKAAKSKACLPSVGKHHLLWAILFSARAHKWLQINRLQTQRYITTPFQRSFLPLPNKKKV